MKAVIACQPDHIIAKPSIDIDFFYLPLLWDPASTHLIR